MNVFARISEDECVWFKSYHIESLPVSLLNARILKRFPNVQISPSASPIIYLQMNSNSTINDCSLDRFLRLSGVLRWRCSRSRLLHRR